MTLSKEVVNVADLKTMRDNLKLYSRLRRLVTDALNVALKDGDPDAAGEAMNLALEAEFVNACGVREAPDPNKLTFSQSVLELLDAGNLASARDLIHSLYEAASNQESRT